MSCAFKGRDRTGHDRLTGANAYDDDFGMSGECRVLLCCIAEGASFDRTPHTAALWELVGMSIHS